MHFKIVCSFSSFGYHTKKKKHCSPPLTEKLNVYHILQRLVNKLQNALKKKEKKRIHIYTRKGLTLKHFITDKYNTQMLILKCVKAYIWNKVLLVFNLG